MEHYNGRLLEVSNDLGSSVTLGESVDTSVRGIWLQLLDSEQGIVFGHSLGTAGSTSLDNARRQPDSQVGNGDVCRASSTSHCQLTGTMQAPSLVLTLGLSRSVRAHHTPVVGLSELSCLD